MKTISIIVTVWLAIGSIVWVAISEVCFVVNGKHSFPPRSGSYWEYFKTMTKCIAYEAQEAIMWIFILSIAELVTELLKLLEKGMIIDFSLEQIEDPFASSYFQNLTKRCAACDDSLFEQFRPLSGTTILVCLNDECPNFTMGYEYEEGKEKPIRKSSGLISQKEKTCFYSGHNNPSA